MIELSPPLCTELLAIARRAIAEYLGDVSLNAELVDAPELMAVRGAFVSLHHGRELRGCIGSLYPRAPLHEIVAMMAVKAASEDPRMVPVTLAELPRLEIEISVLTRPQPISSDDVEVGRHGLYIRHEDRAGLLLPQVATGRGLDRKTFLDWTCRKAGLPEGAWRQPEIELMGFEAQVFADA